MLLIFASTNIDYLAFVWTLQLLYNNINNNNVTKQTELLNVNFFDRNVLTEYVWLLSESALSIDSGAV